MKTMSLKAIQPRSYVPRTTIGDASRSRSPNLLLELKQFPSQINQVLLGDITYLPSEHGWLYLAVWKDLFSRLIAGWELADHMRASLVEQAFEQVLYRRQPAAGMIVHSDGGGQYKAEIFRQLLLKHQFRQSMTRLDNHYDNAFIESLFSRIKAELLSDQSIFINKADARIKVFEYIDGYYNTIRKHSSLGYMSPMQFEKLQFLA